jgi:hypothetical protein
MAKLLIPKIAPIVSADIVNDPNNLERFLDEYYLGLGDTRKLKIDNPLMDKSWHQSPIDEMIDFMRQPENFWYTCKWLFNINLHPVQIAILQEFWQRKFPMFIATRGGGKTFLLALYSVLRAIFEPGAKVVVVGAAFRQSKLLFEYMETLWRNSPIFRNIVGDGKHQGPKRDIDRCIFYIGSSIISAIPLGDGSKIRGLRANYIVADEFASIPQEIFEIVIKGFGSVQLDPVTKVIDQGRIEALKMLGMYREAEDAEEELPMGNQNIISGTAYYGFNHFHDYFVRYRNIINSGGDERKLQEILQGQVPEEFDWKQYSIIRLDVNSMPKGFMDMGQISQAKALYHSSYYLMEYAACFAKDSNGFFKRSLVESCVCSKDMLIGTGETIKPFSAVTSGNPNVKYVYGLDPASENDNFSLVILEVSPGHRKIVYSWSVTRQELRKRMKNTGEATNQSYYNYCARKIRNLMKVFPTDHIAIDAQGGGIAIMEALHDTKLLEEGEVMIWPYRCEGTPGEKDPFWWEKEKKPTDGEPGLHILHMVQFANANFNSEANHNLRKDLENKVILFPWFDSATVGDAIAQDSIANKTYDTLEDCVMEIEAIKDELAIIEHTQTPAGRDKWDTPEVPAPGGKKSRLRKDRYSALVIANQVAHVMDWKLEGQPHNFVGGFVGQQSVSRGVTGQLYTGPAHIVSGMNKRSYGKGVHRQ